jgi:DNA-directed RNA polymerase specialized sigma subunit
MGGTLTRLKGKLLRGVHVAAGDREGEAKATVQQETGREPTDREVEQKTKDVKAEHHDYGERAN